MKKAEKGNRKCQEKKRAGKGKIKNDRKMVGENNKMENIWRVKEEANE